MTTPVWYEDLKWWGIVLIVLACLILLLVIIILIIIIYRCCRYGYVFPFDEEAVVVRRKRPKQKRIQTQTSPSRFMHVAGSEKAATETRTKETVFMQESAGVGPAPRVFVTGATPVPTPRDRQVQSPDSLPGAVDDDDSWARSYTEQKTTQQEVVTLQNVSTVDETRAVTPSSVAVASTVASTSRGNAPREKVNLAAMLPDVSDGSSKRVKTQSKYVTDETRAVKPSSYGATTVTSSTRGNASTERADLATMLPDVNDGSSKKVKTGSRYVTEETRMVKPSSYAVTTVTSSTRGNAPRETVQLATLPEVSESSSKRVKTQSRVMADESRAVTLSSYTVTSTVTSTSRGNASRERVDLSELRPDVGDGSSKTVKTGKTFTFSRRPS